MLGAKTRTDKKTCAHSNGVVVVASGLKRFICEDCNYVSFEYTAEMTAKVNRAMFSREIDLAAATAS